MKSKFIAITLLAATTTIGYSITSFAQTCYDVNGSVATENITPDVQMGNMNLTLEDGSGTVFSETGSLVGNITGADSFGRILLSHKVKFPQGNKFITKDDTAVPDFAKGVYSVRDVDGNGEPCSFWINETISNIVKGTRFFKNVASVNVTAEGYISSCPGNNENYFDLSGTLCVE